MERLRRKASLGNMAAFRLRNRVNCMGGDKVNYRERINMVLSDAIKVRDQKKGKRFECIAERVLETVYESAWHIPAPYSIYNLTRRKKAISTAVGADVELDDRGGVVIIRVITKDLPHEVRFRREDLKGDRLLVGYNRSWEKVYHPLHTHLMIGGASGAGKTDCLRFLIYQLVLQKYDIRVVDMKGFSFLPFDTIPGLTVSRNLEEAAEMLHEAYNELLEREKRVIESRDRSIIKNFQPIVVVIDEAAQIAPKMNNGEARKLARYCDEYCAKISQKGREPRVSLVYCTQRPDADVINGQVKANMEATICFRTKTEVNSRIILDRAGAELIPFNRPGRCIYSGVKDMMCQVPYVGDDDAWSRLLVELKTEVVHHGQSSRTEKERVEIIIEGTDSDNGASGATSLPAERITEQTSVRALPTIRTRKVSRRHEDERYEKGVAALTEGTKGTRSEDEFCTVELPEDETLD